MPAGVARGPWIGGLRPWILRASVWPRVCGGGPAIGGPSRRNNVCHRKRNIEVLRLSLALRSGRTLVNDVWIWLFELKSSTQWRFGLFFALVFVTCLPCEALEFECIFLILQLLHKLFC